MSDRPQRWITVANRLPFSISSSEKKITTSSGGLVSALNGVKTKGQRIWLGCAPENLSKAQWTEIQSQVQNKNSWKFHPLFPASSVYDLYYNGCCNDVLWPLLHYQSELVTFNKSSWEAYREVNQLVANEISSIAKSDDLIWIHDFHLFLVPQLLRKLRPELRIGFFLHVPFPSSEVFRQLPTREEILDSLLSANLVGFHDYSYLRHFCSSILRLLGLETEFLSVRRGAHTTKLGVFPVSIDTHQFQLRSKEEKINLLAKSMRKPTFVFLGVDRLDYMKGLDLKLKAFRILLQKFPQYRERVTLMQIAVPTRKGVPVYNRLARETARLTGEINGEFATPNWTPVQYIHSSVNNQQLIALYKSADALLVSSKRDGMNLVALEYIASQDREHPGVVLLSEFTGAISTLPYALAINPWDLEDTANKMHLAMEMPKQEKLFRLEAMQGFLQNYTATHWAETFITELERPATEATRENAKAIDEQELTQLGEKIRLAQPKRIAIFLDYDGTLVPIQVTPDLAVIDQDTKNKIKMLSQLPWLDLIIVSGRDSRFLNTQFNDLPIWLAAEHGAKSYNPYTKKWKRRVHRNRAIWYPTALKIISDYASRVPHSHVEKKHFAIAWHYRQSPQEYGEFQARKLAEELESGLANFPVNILRGKKVIEVRSLEADKGVFALSHLEDVLPDSFPLVFGDDRTDEDLFRAIGQRGLSFKIGSGPTAANYVLESQADLLPFLTKLCRLLNIQMKKSIASKTPMSFNRTEVHSSHKKPGE